jgi:putative Mg2+ transporter-C (MgtC) family protein
VEQLHALALVFLAMILGAAVGFERERARKPAGLRTHLLVSGASALFVLLSYEVTRDMSLRAPEHAVSADPTRVILAIVTGISFIGAGTVIRSRDSHESSANGGGGAQGVVGLTTAATLLMASAVGVAVALQQFLLALGAVVLSVLALRGLRVVEERGQMNPD